MDREEVSFLKACSETQNLWQQVHSYAALNPLKKALLLLQSERMLVSKATIHSPKSHYIVRLEKLLYQI